MIKNIVPALNCEQQGLSVARNCCFEHDGPSARYIGEKADIFTVDTN